MSNTISPMHMWIYVTGGFAVGVLFGISQKLGRIARALEILAGIQP